MSRFSADFNKVIGLVESGTYASTMTGSSFWLGDVQSNDVSDSEGFIEQRFLGAADRNYQDQIPGPTEVTGTLETNPVDMRLLFWSLGSGAQTSGTNAQFSVTEINSDVQQSPFTSGTLNPPISFTIEDSKQSPGTGRNYNRTIKGVVPNTTTLELSEGEKANLSMDYIGQSMTVTSGATTEVTQPGRRPYLWNHGTLTMGGSTINTARGISFEVNQNREGPNYIDGSRDIAVPFNQNRDYNLEVTMDWEGDLADMIYNEYFKGGSEFNTVLKLDANDSTGSQISTITMSGCRITEPDVPSPLEGLNEVTLTIRPQSVTAEETNSFVDQGLYMDL